mgnify:CR=1 FL=1
MSIHKHLRNFIHERNGSAAIEFALVFPVMVMMFMGMFEVPRYVSANMKLANVAQLMANLVAQQGNMTSALTTNFCTGGQMAMTPLSGTPLKVAIVSVTRGAASVTVDWQDTGCGGASAISGPAGLVTTLIPSVGNSAIIVQATYTYNSPLAYVLSTTYTITQTAFARPRNVKTITHS